MTTDFTLPEIYRSLVLFTDFVVELSKHMNEHVKVTIGRDFSYTFYDVTDYCFTIDLPDGIEDPRQKGVSKKLLVDPIVAMGLFMDSNGLPVSMSISFGNTSHSVTPLPRMKDVKESYGLGILVVAAGKKLSSSIIHKICKKNKLYYRNYIQ